MDLGPECGGDSLQISGKNCMEYWLLDVGMVIVLGILPNSCLFCFVQAYRSVFSGVR